MKMNIIISEDEKYVYYFCGISLLRSRYLFTCLDTSINQVPDWSRLNVCKETPDWSFIRTDVSICLDCL